MACYRNTKRMKVIFSFDTQRWDLEQYHNLVWNNYLNSFITPAIYQWPEFCLKRGQTKEKCGGGWKPFSFYPWRILRKSIRGKEKRGLIRWVSRIVFLWVVGNESFDFCLRFWEETVVQRSHHCCGAAKVTWKYLLRMSWFSWGTLKPMCPWVPSVIRCADHTAEAKEGVIKSLSH